MTRKSTRTMLLCILSLLLFQPALLLQATEVEAMWARLYRRAGSNEHRYQIMLNMVELDSRDLGSFYLDALEQQIADFQNIRGTDERLVSNRLTMLTLRELGRGQIAEAADAVWNMLEINADVTVMSEAARTLGRINATQYAPRLAGLLRNMNMGISPLEVDREVEAVAYNTVIALSQLREPVGFEPVFFAAEGWYSARSGVRAAAREALPQIMEDPTEILIDIMRAHSDLEVKLSALTVGLQSSASDTRRADFAARTLEHVLPLNWSTRAEQRVLIDIRTHALRAIRDLDHKSPRAIPSMARMLTQYRVDRLYNEDEMLVLLEAVGTFNDDESTRALADFMRYLTERRDRGIPPDSLRIARGAVIALGNTGNPAAMEDLNMIIYSDQWEASIKREARAALGRLMN